MPVPECSTSSSPGGLPGICAACFLLPPVLVCIWFNLRFRTAPVLARTGGAVVAGAGALLVMFFSGVVEEKNDFMLLPLCAGAFFVFFGGMLPCSTIEGSDFFWWEIPRLILGVLFVFFFDPPLFWAGVLFEFFLTPPPLFWACILFVFFDSPPFFGQDRNFPNFLFFWKDGTSRRGGIRGGGIGSSGAGEEVMACGAALDDFQKLCADM